MKRILFTAALLVYGLATSAQSYLSTIYDVKNADGSVMIMVKNEGFAPLTVQLKADLVNMSTTTPLPARIAVRPSASPQVLTILRPTKSGSGHYHYSYFTQLGIYSSILPDTSYLYKLPYKATVGSKPNEMTFITSAGPPYHRHYQFKLPDNTPVCAARAGIVANIKEDLSSNKRYRSNFVCIYHEDGTYAWYEGLARNSVGLKLGQWVPQGEIIGYSEGQKHNASLIFAALYPGESTPKELSVLFDK